MKLGIGLGIPYPYPNGFSPASLFAAGEQGVWYDPSDMSTLFQDAAGTTPVTAVEQPVGLMLDKSGRGNHASQPTTTARPILRARYNFIDDSEFSLGILGTFSGVTLSSLAGYAAAVAFQPSAATIYAYKLGINLDVPITFSFTVRMDDGGEPNFLGSASSPLTDFKVVVRGNAYNGANGTHKISQVGEGVYRISVTTTSPGVSANFGIVKYAANSLRSFVVTAYDVRYAIHEDNPKYQRTTSAADYDTVGFRPYLAPDGTDDWMSTGNIDFSSMSNMSIVAGVEKLNDLAPFYQAVAELGPGNSNGSFSLWHPYSDIQHSRVIFRGDGAAQGVIVSDVPGTRTDVLTATAELDVYRIRYKVSGTQYPDYVGAADSGKFGNLPLYLFSRAGTSARFRGTFYGLIVVGRLLNAGELASAHEFMRNKSRAY